jgi:hypothetical protein
MSPTGLRDIELVRNGTTELLPYEGPSPLQLVAEAGGVPLRIEADIPAEVDRVMILVFGMEPGEDGLLRSATFAYASDELGPGMARVMNGSDRMVYVGFTGDEERLTPLKAGRHLDFSADEMTPSTYPRVYVFEHLDNGHLRRLHINRLFLEENEVNLFLIRPRGRRVEIMRLGDMENIETDSLFPEPEVQAEEPDPESPPE